MSRGEARAVVRGLYAAIEPVAVLANRLRRELYVYVRARQRPVSRDEAAEQAGISPRLAAFHLDRLVRARLLQASYARKPGRSGPGAGRSSKFYQPSDLEIDLSIPERRYDLLAQVLVAALDEQPAPPREAATRVAYETGQLLGKQASKHPDPRDRALDTASEVLACYGFEPYSDGTGTLAMANCPFHALARRSPELVCHINHGLISGILDGLGAHAAHAVREPTPGRCCVRLHTRTSPNSP